MVVVEVLGLAWNYCLFLVYDESAIPDPTKNKGPEYRCGGVGPWDTGRNLRGMLPSIIEVRNRQVEEINSLVVFEPPIYHHKLDHDSMSAFENGLGIDHFERYKS